MAAGYTLLGQIQIQWEGKFTLTPPLGPESAYWYTTAMEKNAQAQTSPTTDHQSGADG
ncbi:hypothetical protein PENSUB_2155 [Penicillium subrubescens]|jgi:hypothetical protein|uniref:Uncharacterized protein n=1 Tax=Penicillium subrubescens TaxID=1316194 RepID=A0A1Q5UJ08_9EURO|nr:hypothetical protein PENSUB_2155 [Penicillium subrubescens]